MLDASAERQLEQLMASYESGSDHEVALLTIPSLEGDSLEGFSLRVARSWKIGKKGLENGALLLVAKDDRKMRIEVGRGLEGTLTDAVASRILRHVLEPAFKRGDFEDGLRDGVVAIHAALGGDYGPIEQARRRSRGGGIGGAVFMVMIMLFFLFGAGRRGGRGGGGGGMGWLPWLLLMNSGGSRHSWGHGGSSGGGFGGFGGGGGFGGFGGGGGFSGGGASGGW